MGNVKKINGHDICDEFARNEVSIARNRKYIFIGDSYGTGADGGDGLTLTTWSTLIKDYMKIPDENYYHNSVGYAGFLNGDSKFIDILKTFDDVITDKETITDIVVCGGYNDKYYQQPDIESGISEFATYVKTNYPNATFRLGCIGWHGGSHGAHPIVNQVLPAYKNVVKYGGVYLNNIEYSLHLYSSFCSDKVHPNQTGNNNIAKHLANALLTGKADVNYYDVGVDTLSCLITDGSVDSTGGVIRTSLNNNVASIWTRSWLGITIPSQAIYENRNYDLCKLGNNRVVSGGCNVNNDDTYNTTITTTIFFNINGSLKGYPCMLFIKNNSSNECILCMRILGAGGSIGNVTIINIPPFKMVFDSLHA